MKFKNIKFVILYGSQTGNSKDVAERIWRESRRFYYDCSIYSLDEYNVLNLIKETFVVFVCSTTGEGQEPDNMKSFWKFLLRKKISPDALINLKFAVCGLGDSSYAKFNFVAKRLFRRLWQLGGQPIVQLGLGDDQHDLGYDGIVDPWIEELWSKLLELYPLPSGVQQLPKILPLLPRWNVKTSLLDNESYVSDSSKSIFYPTSKPLEFTVTVLENKRLTHPNHFQDVRLIKFKTNEEEYSPGDIVTIRPKNLTWQIDEFLEVLKANNVNIPLETVFTISENCSHTSVPNVLRRNVIFKQLVEEYFDLMAVPRRHVFYVLSQLTDSELERQKCLEFTTAEGQNDLLTYTRRPRRNIVEVLKDFPHATKHLNGELLFEILTPIQPREFSIASSCSYHKGEIHILVAVVQYKTNLAKRRFGLCSNFLADLCSGDNITVWTKKGSFNFPNCDSPVIMIGPGTGLSAFRSFILEKYYEGNRTAKDLVLIFGCRYQDKDFLCKDELEKLKNENKLNLICAFSRDQENKVYVQDKIKEHGKYLWKLVQENAFIFVSGNAKNMPRSVEMAFIDLCIKYGDMDQETATKYIEHLKKCRRYQTECW